MQPFYFGRPDKSLFGIYHPPSGDRTRDCGIVICYPMGREYILGYRALRQLAYQLTRAGFAVLRFDYYGCGDSSGDAHEGSVTQWMTDIETAIEEVKHRGDSSKICLIGARLGAGLGVLVGSQRSDVETIVLWDPVVDGKNYVTDLIAQHQEWLNERTTELQTLPSTQQTLEVLGYPFSATLQDGLERVNLLDVGRCPAKHVLTLESDKTSSGKQLSDHWRETGADSEYQHISGSRVWLRSQGADNVVVPAQILHAIVGWVSRITS